MGSKLVQTFLKYSNRMKKTLYREYILDTKMQRPEQIEIPKLSEDNRKLILVMFHIGKLALKD